MAIRYVDRLGVLIVIGGGLLLYSATMPVLEAQTRAPRPAASAPADAASTADRDDAITVTGCLLLGPYGDYTLSRTIDQRGLALNALAWKLERNPALLGHVLEQVEVTGTMQPVPPGAESDRPSDSSNRTASYRLRVKSIKKVGVCS